jgi:hypothetical protein
MSLSGISSSEIADRLSGIGRLSAAAPGSSVMHFGCRLRVSSRSTAERVHSVAWIGHLCRLVTLLGNEQLKTASFQRIADGVSHAGPRMNVCLSDRRSINAH